LFASLVNREFASKNIDILFFLIGVDVILYLV